MDNSVLIESSSLVQRRNRCQERSASNAGRLILLERAGFRAVGKAVAAAGAFTFDNFVHVVDILHLRMDGVLRADFAEQAAGDTEAFDDPDFHAVIYFEPPNARLGSGARGFVKLKSSVVRLHHVTPSPSTGEGRDRGVLLSTLGSSTPSQILPCREGVHEVQAITSP